MGSPWLIGQIDSILKGKEPIQEPSPKERLSIALEQLNSLIELKGEHGLLIARKHLNWTCTGFSRSSTFRQSLVRAPTSQEAIKLIEEKIVSLS